MGVDLLTVFWIFPWSCTASGAPFLCKNHKKFCGCCVNSVPEVDDEDERFLQSSVRRVQRCAKSPRARRVRKRWFWRLKSETKTCTANQPHQDVAISLLMHSHRHSHTSPPKRQALLEEPWRLLAHCKLRNFLTLCPDMVTGYIYEMLSRHATPASICYRASILGFTWWVRWETAYSFCHHIRMLTNQISPFSRALYLCGTLKRLYSVGQRIQWNDTVPIHNQGWLKLNVSFSLTIAT